MKIKDDYNFLKNKIIKRLNEFKKVLKESSDEDIFAELTFCILTPQSKAKVCWAAVENLKNKKLLFDGNKSQIIKELKGIRFKNKKANYIICARKKYEKVKKIIFCNNPYDVREYLVKNIKGIGWKEASHFLRNIGLGDNLAILDRHILKNLKELNIINDIPEYLSKKVYLKIEEKMNMFAKKINIPISHLDLLLWCKETGEMFK